MMTLFCLVVWINLLYTTFGGFLKATCDSNIDFGQWQTNSPPNSSYTLIQSNVYIRHGDRTIWQSLPCFTGEQQMWECSETIAIQPTKQENNSNTPAAFSFQLLTINGSNVLPGNCLIGQLTSIGYQQQIKNGNGIKQRYVDYYNLIPNTFEQGSSLNNIILIRSDDSPRVQQSAMAFFEGMYENLDNNPAETFVLPFETSDGYYQIMTPNENVCPYLTTMRQMNEVTIEYQTHKNTITIPLVNEAQSFMITPNATENQIFDCGTVWGCHHKKVPDAYTQQLYDQINADFAWYGMYAATNPNYINATKYNNGPLLKLIFSRLYSGMMFDQNNKLKDDTYKMYLYGGHDSGVVPIIAALGYNVTGWVPYADIISFELFKRNNDGRYFVLMSYNGNPLKPEMCDCQNNPYHLCSWDKFQAFMETITPTQSECPGMRNIPSIEQYYGAF